MAAKAQERRERVKEREKHAVIPLHHGISHWIQRIYLTYVQIVSVLVFKDPLQTVRFHGSKIIKC